MFFLIIGLVSDIRQKLPIRKKEEQNKKEGARTAHSLKTYVHILCKVSDLFHRVVHDDGMPSKTKSAHRV